MRNLMNIITTMMLRKKLRVVGVNAENHAKADGSAYE